MNRAGGASAIGARSVAQVAQVAADGYTLENFRFLCAYGQGVLFLAVRSDRPDALPADCVAAARQARGRLNYATDSSAGLAHFRGTLLWRAAGVDVVHVP